MSKPKMSRFEKIFVSQSTRTFRFSPEPRYWWREETDDHAPTAYLRFMCTVWNSKQGACFCTSEGLFQPLVSPCYNLPFLLHLGFVLFTGLVIVRRGEDKCLRHTCRIPKGIMERLHGLWSEIWEVLHHRFAPTRRSYCWTFAFQTTFVVRLDIRSPAGIWLTSELKRNHIFLSSANRCFQFWSNFCIFLSLKFSNVYEVFTAVIFGGFHFILANRNGRNRVID